MKTTLILTLAMGLVFAMMANAQEPPEPNPELTLECQIKWYGDGEWEELTGVTAVVNYDPLPTSHKFYGLLGTQTLRAKARIGDESPTPQTVTLTFEINELPDGAWWGFYRFRFRRISDDPEASEILMSPASDWRCMFNLHQPGKPVAM